MEADSTRDAIEALEAACRKRLTKADGTLGPVTRQAERVQFHGWGAQFESDIVAVDDRVGTMFALSEALKGQPELKHLQALLISKEQAFQRVYNPGAPEMPSEHLLPQARYLILADIVDSLLAGEAPAIITERVSAKFEATFLAERPYIVAFPVINLRLEGDLPLDMDPRLRLRKLSPREREDLVSYAAIFPRMDVETAGHVEWVLEIRFDLDVAAPTLHIQSNKISQAVLTLLRLRKDERIEFGAGETKPLHYREGQSWSSYEGRRHRFIPDTYTISAGERLEVNSMWSAIGSRLTEPASQSLGLAIRRFRDASQRSIPADALVDYIISMEALLLAGDHGKTTEAFVQRGAAILGGSREEKREIRRRLEHFYNLRSEVVHGRNDFTDGAELRRLRATAKRLLLWYLGQPKDFEPSQIGEQIDEYRRAASSVPFEQYLLERSEAGSR